MTENIVIIGIGGTGAKIVEALVHLGASSNAPKNIYPVIIDQDEHNGNVAQCKQSINEYIEIFNCISEIDDRWIFGSKIENISDKLLPLVPDDEEILFRAAIEVPSMTQEEQMIIDALYTSKQLNDPLKLGYKKRSHMGSILMKKLLEKEDNKPDTSPGLQMIISKTRAIDDLCVVVCGSLFGGTGASGIVNIGKYFRDKMENAIIKGIMLTPYFKISDSYDPDENYGGIVRSDSDMQMVKVALEMYEDDIESAFDHVYILGSEIKEISSDVATEKAFYGGEKQKNPAHIFELLAATVTMHEANTGEKYFKYIIDTTKDRIPDFTFRLSDFPKILNKKWKILRDFANMLVSVKDNTTSWKKRQPWLARREKYDKLYDWADRHHSWWKEMSDTRWKNDHHWKSFNIKDELINDKYKMCALTSMHLKKLEAISISDTLYAVDRLCKIY